MAVPRKETHRGAGERRNERERVCRRCLWSGCMYIGPLLHRIGGYDRDRLCLIYAATILHIFAERVMRVRRSSEGAETGALAWRMATSMTFVLTNIPQTHYDDQCRRDPSVREDAWQRLADGAARHAVWVSEEKCARRRFWFRAFVLVVRLRNQIAGVIGRTDTGYTETCLEASAATH